MHLKLFPPIEKFKAFKAQNNKKRKSLHILNATLNQDICILFKYFTGTLVTLSLKYCTFHQDNYNLVEPFYKKISYSPKRSLRF
jgi:hypothetical protein